MQEQEQDITIPEMVENVRSGKMDRRTLFKRLTFMGLSVAGAAAIGTVAGRQIAAHNAPSVNGDNNSQQHIQNHDQHLAHQSTGDIQQLHHDYHADAIVEDSMYATPFVGRAAILARKSAGFAAMPDVQIKVTNRVVHGDQLTVEWIASGTHLHDYPGLPATGRSFSIPGVTVVVRLDGMIVRESLYYDMAEVQRQLSVQ
ncbi:MAG: ester cyclase [Ktedonobacteraceae bacterium]